MDKIMAVALGTSFIGIFIGLAFGFLSEENLKFRFMKTYLRKLKIQ